MQGLERDEHFLNKLNSRGYHFSKVLHKGKSGQIFECVWDYRGHHVAVKIPDTKYGDNEADIVRKLKNWKMEEFNIVRCIEEFIVDKRNILVFEKLDITLENYTIQSHHSSMRLLDITDIMKQMGKALTGLHNHDIIHADVNPSNIMILKKGQKPFKVRLIDFGSSMLVSEGQQGSKADAIGFMSPEMMLGAPITKATDVWSLGCVLAYLSLGYSLFSTDSEEDAFQSICEIIGQPSKKLLDKGPYTSKFYQKDRGKWTLKTSENARHKDQLIESLDELMMTGTRRLSKKERQAQALCIDLLKKMLKVNPEDRITATDVQKHPFITGRYPYKTLLHKRNKILPLNLPLPPKESKPSQPGVIVVKPALENNRTSLKDAPRSTETVSPSPTSSKRFYSAKDQDSSRLLSSAATQKTKASMRQLGKRESYIKEISDVESQWRAMKREVLRDKEMRQTYISHGIECYKSELSNQSTIKAMKEKDFLAKEERINIFALKANIEDSLEIHELYLSENKKKFDNAFSSMQAATNEELELDAENEAMIDAIRGYERELESTSDKLSDYVRYKELGLKVGQKGEISGYGQKEKHPCGVVDDANLQLPAPEEWLSQLSELRAQNLNLLYSIPTITANLQEVIRDTKEISVKMKEAEDKAERELGLLNTKCRKRKFHLQKLKLSVDLHETLKTASDQDAMLEDLNQKVSRVYKQCMEKKMLIATTMEKVDHMERYLFNLLEQLESVPEEFVKEILKAKAIQREMLRQEEKLRRQREKAIERKKKCKERTFGEFKKILAKKLMARTFFRRLTQKRDRMHDSEEFDIDDYLFSVENDD